MSLPRVVGRYELHHPIASGGMATVHLGRLRGQAGFSRIVAIKRLHPSFGDTPTLVSTLLDEARLCSRIQHPHVVPTLDMVAEDDELLLVLDYVHGETLARLLGASDGPPEPEVVSAIMSGVLHGLHAAHEATGSEGEPLGLVHRDVSPQNIMVGSDGLARVLDFGVAKARGRMQTTREGQVKGKLAYMAPEQIRGGDLDRRCDVFAAGVVMWEALTRRRLFSGDNEGQVLHRVLSAPIEPPSAHRPELDAAYDAIVLRALARDPDERFVTAKELALAIEKETSLATSSEVGAWVVELAGEALAERAAMVAALERGEQAPSPTLSDPEARTQTETGLERPASSEEVTVSAQGVAVQRTSPPPPRRWTLAVGALAALAGVGLWWGTRSEPATLRATPLAVSRPSAKDASATEVELEVVTDPPGASVHLLGREHGPTPVTIGVPTGREALDLRLTMEGHEPLQRVIVPDKDQRLELALTASPLASATAASSPRPVAPKTGGPAEASATPGEARPKPGPSSPFYRFE